MGSVERYNIGVWSGTLGECGVVQYRECGVVQYRECGVAH